MPLSNYPRGITSFGIPITGSGNVPRFLQWTSNHEVFFVDGSNGANGNSGKEPQAAFATIEKAITEAGANDVIYVREKAWGDGVATATDPGFYNETNLTIAVAKQGLALIGTGPNLYNSFGPQIKCSASGTTLTINAPTVVVENLDFNRGSATNYHILVQYDDTGTTQRGQGVAIANCHLRNKSQNSTSGAIGCVGAWYLDIVNNLFTACRIGCYIFTGGSVTNGVTIRGNVFRGGSGTSDGTDIDAHIYVNAGPHYNIVIDHNVFATALPALSGGLVLRYIRFQAGTQDGICSNNVFASRADHTYGAAGSGVIIPTSVGWVNNYGDEGASGTQLLARA